MLRIKSLELWQRMYQEELGLNVVTFPAGAHGPDLLAWTNKPLNKLEDWKGLKFRTISWWGEILKSIGVSVVSVPGAKESKAIIILNPAEPPITMHNTIYTVVKDLNEEKYKIIEKSIHDIVKKIQSYVPGYLLAFFLYREKIDAIQVMGIVISLIGVFWIIFQGKLELLLQMSVNPGDIIMLLSVISWASYSLVYRKKAEAFSPRPLFF